MPGNVATDPEAGAKRRHEPAVRAPLTVAGGMADGACAERSEPPGQGFSAAPVSLAEQERSVRPESGVRSGS